MDELFVAEAVARSEEAQRAKAIARECEVSARSRSGVGAIAMVAVLAKQVFCRRASGAAVGR